MQVFAAMADRDRDRSRTPDTLLDETLYVLTQAGKRWREVAWVGCEVEDDDGPDGGWWMSWEDFAVQARQLVYEFSADEPQIRLDLKVVGAEGTWWLERYADFDRLGQLWVEGWRYRTAPEKPEVREPRRSLRYEESD